MGIRATAGAPRYIQRNAAASGPLVKDSFLCEPYMLVWGDKMQSLPYKS